MSSVRGDQRSIGEAIGGTKSTSRGGLAVDFLACLAAALVWSWPLALRLTTHLRDAYDAQAGVWILSWLRHALRHAPGEIFHANAFAPARDVLAFSEPDIAYGVAGIPFALLGLNAVGIANLLSLLGLAFLPWCVMRLARDLGAARTPAFLGAVAACFGAFATVSLGYFYFAAAGGIAIVLMLWLRFLAARSVASLAVVGLSLGLLGWFSLQLLAFAGAALAALALVHASWRSARQALREFGSLAAACAFAALLILPLAIPLLRVRQREGFRRDEAETRRFSARPSDFLATTHANPGQAFLPFRVDSEKSLYPGTMALALALLGLGAATRSRRTSFRNEVGDRFFAPTLVSVGATLVGVGVFGSLGYGSPFFPLLVRLAPPLFGGIRAVSRFTFVTEIGFALLAAAGASALFAKVQRAPKKTAAFGLAATITITIALIIAIAFDVRQSASLPFRPEIPVPPLERFLAAADTAGPIVHLPLHHGPGDARYLFGSLTHFKPLVNGTLSYIPARHLLLSAALRSDPIAPEVMRTLESWPVGTIVAHEHALPFEQRRATLRFLLDGVENGRLTRPLFFPHRGGLDLVFGVETARPHRNWETAGGGDPVANTRELAGLASGAPDPSGMVRDESIFAFFDHPVDGERVQGDLLIRGWSETEQGDTEVLEARIDGDLCPERVARVPRPDVAHALPKLGPCSRAGFELRHLFRPEDEGTHDLSILFRAPGGRIKTLRSSFTWSPGEKLREKR